MKIIILQILLLIVQICMAKKEVDLIRLANCPEYKNYSVIYQNLVFKRNKIGKAVSVKFDMVFKREVKRMLISATVRKCDNSGNLDSCEYYMKDFKINNACDIVGKKNQLWSEAVSNSNFPRSCPISAGTYRLNDTKLDGFLQLTLMPIPSALWKIKLFSYDAGNGNAMICCTDLDLKIYSTRRNS